MPAQRTCRQCGAPLPENAPGGRCPKCLMQLALEETQAGQGEAGGDVPQKTVVLHQSDMVIERTGMMIGRYKLLQQIGEGGFGTVFMAEQQEPVQRKVALKLIKAGMDTREIIARFEAERQALALMDHPNIAQVLDGGATATGRPYFVMELVRGIPIINYCDQANLCTRERLELFIKVCRAVQHAHQKGVIHRDLKPSNVLVTLHDGEPVPKVIDFGVAKALGQKLTDKTLFTRFEQMIGTPAYMSPEQAALSGLDVDTRSDIYSLGVLLYELLTGVTPLDAETLRQAALDEVRRMIQETEPPKPSTRLSNLVAADVRRLTTSSAEKDRASLRRLLQQKKELVTAIRGDLDWITMKALEKDRRRRYETVSGLAADIDRHLRDEPVVARPPSALYRVQKVARRHRVAFAAGAVVTLALVLGLVTSTWQAVRATHAERQARNAQANEASQRQRAERNARAADRSAAESRSRLVRQYVANGNRLVDEGDLIGALPWFAKALQEERDNPGRADIHRLRLGTTLQQCPRLVQVWFHKDVVNDATFSPDGHWVLTASGDGVARVWDAATGEPASPPLQNSASIFNAVFSSDGQRVATATVRGGVGVWDARNGRLLFPFLRGGMAVQFSPDGGRLIIVGGKAAQLFDATTGEKMGDIMGHQGAIWATFSPDGRRVVSINGDTARVWDGTTGKPVTDPISYVGAGNSPDFGNIRSVRGPEFSPDGGRFTLACGDSTARVLDAATGKQVLLVRHRGIVRRASFSPDGRWLATASHDSTAQVWDSATGVAISPPLRHKGPVLDVSFSRKGGLVVTASTDGAVRVWDAATGRQVAAALQHARAAGLASFSPDGEWVLTVSEDQAVRVWEWRGAAEAYLAVKHSAVAHAAAVSPDGRRSITASVDGTAHVWDLTTGQSLTALQTTLSAVRRVQFSPDSRLLAVGTTNGTARVWDMATGQPISPVLVHTGPVNHVEFSPSGKRLVTAGSDRLARVWEVTSGRIVSEMPHRESVNYASFTPDGKQVVTVTLSVPEAFQSGDRRTFDPVERKAITADWGQAHLWNAETGQAQSAPLKLGMFVSLASFSPDRLKVLATCSARGLTEKQAWVVDLMTGRRLSGPLEHDKGLIHGSFSPDGKWVVTTSWDHTARVWDVTTGQPVGPRLRHQTYVYYAVFSADSRLVATASADHTARVWDAATGEPVTPPLKHGAAVNRAFFGPDDRWLLTAGADGGTRLWKLAKANRAVEDGVLLAQLLAGHWIDETDALLPMNADAMERAWAKLRLQQTLEDGTGSQPMLARQSSRPVMEEEYYVPGEDTEASLGLNNPYGKQLETNWSQLNLNFNQPYSFSLDSSRSSELAEFIEVCSKAIEADPDPQHGGQYLRRAHVHELLGQYQQAIADMREWLWRIGPIPNMAFLVRQYFLLGRCYSALSKTEKAETYLQRAQDCANENAEACDYVALSYTIGPTNFGSFKKALPLALKAVELSRTNPPYATTLAEVYSRLGQPQKAADILEKAIQLHPDENSLIWNNLAWYYVTGPKEIQSPQKALPLALKALKAGNTNHNELNTLGVVYYRLGQLSNAVRTLEAGIKADKEGGSAHDFFFLAMSYQRLGDSSRAQEYFVKATNWVAAQANLPPNDKAELDAFRAEADEVLSKPKAK